MPDRDALADVLRRTDVAQRGGNVAGLLPFEGLNGPEQVRWRALADAAIAEELGPLRERLALTWRAALRWYADADRYYGHDPEALADNGSRARAALDGTPPDTSPPQHVFLVLGDCDSFYCNGKHPVAVCASRDQADAIQPDAPDLQGNHGPRYTDLSVVELPYGTPAWREDLGGGCA